jgi:hypothetical protein
MHLFLLLALTCPVLDTATVSAAIGEVRLEVVERRCTFTNSDYQLIVAITTLTSPNQFAKFSATACEGSYDSTPVKGIGNEAVACSLRTSSRISEKLVSRVRNQAFTLTLNTIEKSATAKSVRSCNIALAEQVAGNLF